MKTIATYLNSTLIIKTDGSLWAAGLNKNGNIGLGDIAEAYSFTNTGKTNIVDISIGRDFSVIIDGNGALYGSGIGTYFGHGSSVTTYTALSITNAKQVSCGLEFTIVLDTDSKVWSTGINASGQLGLGDTTARTSYVDTGVNTIKNISTGNVHTMRTVETTIQ